MRYADSIPSNSRITVDYTGDKPEVKFEYPVNTNKKDWIFSFIFPSILVVWGFMSILGVICCGIVSELSGITIMKLQGIIGGILSFIITIMIVFIPPMIISYIICYNYEKFKFSFPKFQASVTRLITWRKHFHTFSVNKLEEQVFEIPLFKNVMLEYEASEEFSEYLQRVEIREHEFMYKGKEKTQWLWKARFVFSDIPKTGELKGEFW